MNNEVTAAAIQKALSTYPLYQGKKEYDLIPTREQLNTKILNHYKYREIGFETVGRFLDELQITMEEIMPLYNERFKSIEIMADIKDPFATVNMIEVYEQSTTGTSSSEGTSTDKQTGTSSQTGTTSQTATSEQSGTSNSESSDTSKVTGDNTETNTNSQTANGKLVKSDTPQNSLGIGSEGIDTVDYASEAQWSKDTTTNNGSSSSNSETNTTSSGTSNGSTSSTSESSTEGTSSSQNTSETTGQGSSTSSSETAGTMRYTLTKEGGQGVTTYGHDMIEYRQSFIDVVNEIINDHRLAELFMLVY